MSRVTGEQHRSDDQQPVARDANGPLKQARLHELSQRGLVYGRGVDHWSVGGH
jgi:hypothetical protein